MELDELQQQLLEAQRHPTAVQMLQHQMDLAHLRAKLHTCRQPAVHLSETAGAAVRPRTISGASQAVAYAKEVGITIQLHSSAAELGLDLAAAAAAAAAAATAAAAAATAAAAAATAAAAANRQSLQCLRHYRVQQQTPKGFSPPHKQLPDAASTKAAAAAHPLLDPAAAASSRPPPGWVRVAGPEDEAGGQAGEAFAEEDLVGQGSPSAAVDAADMMDEEEWV